MQAESRKECGGGYLCPRHTLLSGIWNLYVQVEQTAAYEAEEEEQFFPANVYWEELTPTERGIFEEQFIPVLSSVGELISRIAMIHKEHKELR